MFAKFDEIGDRFSRVSVFVPDIAGPRALPSTLAPSSTGRCSCFSAAGARCFRCDPPRWLR